MESFYCNGVKEERESDPCLALFTKASATPLLNNVVGITRLGIEHFTSVKSQILTKLIRHLTTIS